MVVEPFEPLYRGTWFFLAKPDFMLLFLVYCSVGSKLRCELRRGSCYTKRSDQVRDLEELLEPLIHTGF